MSEQDQGPAFSVPGAKLPTSNFIGELPPEEPPPQLLHLDVRPQFRELVYVPKLDPFSFRPVGEPVEAMSVRAGDRPRSQRPYFLVRRDPSFDEVAPVGPYRRFWALMTARMQPTRCPSGMKWERAYSMQASGWLPEPRWRTFVWGRLLTPQGRQLRLFRLPDLLAWSDVEAILPLAAGQAVAIDWLQPAQALPRPAVTVTDCVVDQADDEQPPVEVRQALQLPSDADTQALLKELFPAWLEELEEAWQ